MCSVTPLGGHVLNSESLASLSSLEQSDAESVCNCYRQVIELQGDKSNLLGVLSMAHYLAQFNWEAGATPTVLTVMALEVAVQKAGLRQCAPSLHVLLSPLQWSLLSFATSVLADLKKVCCPNLSTMIHPQEGKQVQADTAVKFNRQKNTGCMIMWLSKVFQCCAPMCAPCPIPTIPDCWLSVWPKGGWKCCPMTFWKLWHVESTKMIKNARDQMQRCWELLENKRRSRRWYNQLQPNKQDEWDVIYNIYIYIHHLFEDVISYLEKSALLKFRLSDASCSCRMVLETSE